MIPLGNSEFPLIGEVNLFFSSLHRLTLILLT